MSTADTAPGVPATGTMVVDSVDDVVVVESVNPSAFRRFWAAHSVSTFGDQVSLVALPVATFARTGSSLAVGVVAAMEALTALVFGLFAGVAADRWSHRRLLVTTDLVRFGVLASLAAVVAGGDYPVPALYATAFLLGALRVLHDAAAGAALPGVVEAPRLVWANGRLNASEAAGNAVGPALAGGVIRVAGTAAAFLVDAVTFLASGLGLSKLPLPTRRKNGATRSSVRTDIREGLGALWRSRPVMQSLVVAAAMNVVAVAVEAQFIPYAAEVLGIGAFGVGAFFALGGAAGVVASLMVGRSGVVRGDAIVGGAGLFAVGVLSAGMWPNLVTTAIAFTAAGVGSALVISHVAALRQRSFPIEMLGRVGMASRLVLFSGVPVAYVGGGLLAEAQGPDVLFASASIVGLVAAAWGVAVGLARIRVGGPSRSPAEEPAR